MYNLPEVDNSPSFSCVKKNNLVFPGMITQRELIFLLGQLVDYALQELKPMSEQYKLFEDMLIFETIGNR